MNVLCRALPHPQTPACGTPTLPPHRTHHTHHTLHLQVRRQSEAAADELRRAQEQEELLVKGGAAELAVSNWGYVTIANQDSRVM